MWGRSPGEGSADFAEIPFSIERDLFPLAAGVLMALVVGLLRGLGLCGVIATASLVVLGLALGYWANFTSFGGFCLDPGEDVCVVTLQEHAGGLLVPALALVAGWFAETVGRSTRANGG
jgi:hypothetical protein